MTVVYWFKRDLRVEDNPGLAAAAAREAPVVPLYIAEPELWAQPDAAARTLGVHRREPGGFAG